eukprot:614698_1
MCVHSRMKNQNTFDEMFHHTKQHQTHPIPFRRDEPPNPHRDATCYLDESVLPTPSMMHTIMHHITQVLTSQFVSLYHNPCVPRVMNTYQQNRQAQYDHDVRECHSKQSQQWTKNFHKTLMKI